MLTVDFPYYDAPFPEFNPVQSKVVPFIAMDNNLVICFQTATGKTALAECAFAYHLSVTPDKACVYVCPFKSLGQEKYNLWSGNRQLSSKRVVISTGDHSTTRTEFCEAGLTLVTAESFDYKLRAQDYAGWVNRIACVVFDEAQVMGSRNGSIEASLMRLTKVNPSARIILLSATLGNAKELATWLKTLNGKKTLCFTSNWRAQKVETQIHVVDDGKDSKVKAAIDLAQKSTGKTLVFVHSKLTGSEICARLKKKGIRSAFHNASVAKGTRAKIEEAFAGSSSGLDVLVSTSTLGSGVNLTGES